MVRKDCSPSRLLRHGLSFHWMKWRIAMTFRQEYTVRERFEQKFIPEPNSGCWFWTDSLDSYGYGRLVVTQSPRHKLFVQAHRLSWRLYNGVLPEDLDVLHTCDMRSCVNPEHLYIGTHQDNMDDMVQRGRLPQTRLTDKDVIAIRADIRSHRVIAAFYGVTLSHVYKVKSGRARLHIV